MKNTGVWSWDNLVFNDIAFLGGFGNRNLYYDKCIISDREKRIAKPGEDRVLIIFKTCNRLPIKYHILIFAQSYFILPKIEKFI